MDGKTWFKILLLLYFILPVSIGCIIGIASYNYEIYMYEYELKNFNHGVYNK